MASTSPLSSSGSEQTDPFIHRIEIWRLEVAAATTSHPTPVMPAPQSILQRFHGRLVRKMRDVKEKMGVVKEEMPQEEGKTEMYGLTAKGKEIERREQEKVWRTAERSWNVDEDQMEGSTEGVESSSELRGEERRVDERQARLERAAQLLMRQKHIELEEMEAMGKAQVLV